MSTPSVPLVGTLAAEVARNRLGVPGVVGNQLSQIAPGTVIYGVVPAVIAATGLIGVPIAMVIVAAALYLFLVGWLAMGRYIPNPGAFYAYIALGLWKPLGVAAAWLALAAYVSFAIGSYIGFGFTLSAVLDAVAGFSVPWWACSLTIVVIIGALAIRSLKGAAVFIIGLVVFETLGVIITTVGAAAAPGFRLSLAAMDPTLLTAATAGSLAVTAIMSYVGYEAAATYLRDSRDPERTVPLASKITLITTALLYWIASWVQVSAAGPKILDRAKNEGVDMFSNSAAVTLGSWVVVMNAILFSTSLFAASFAFQLVGPRYLSVLGQERVLPAFFGKTINEAPRNASLTVSAVAAVVITGYALGGLDPLTQGFLWLGTTGAIGIMLLSATASVAVVAFFARDRRGETLWHRVIAPAAAAVALGMAGYFALTNLGTLYGPGSETIAAAVPWVLLALLVLGVLWGLRLQVQQPAVYANIGLGIEAKNSAFDELFAPGVTTAAATAGPAAHR
ncbi:APC family permease [Actinoplanes derwentensis]|uniref:Amino acid transporter n=1 Tax=Actinoplanes derwentensis TaxID=113562 RepID=A0A1H2CVJ6_9ACTN|nr:APC family permease [Actinoplanes derwentensis]GID82052.1 amino acid permease [Actinoplanes derwentensis]SDT74481.1 Amino acid transporter [Actinoplanes derwentensis]